MTDTTIALVTGANKGLGYETARQLARLGMTVLLGSRDPERGEDATRTLRAEGVTVAPVQLDVTDPASVAHVGELIERDHGRLDVLVSNAGMLVWKIAEDVDADDMRETFATNVFGVVTVVHTMLPLLRASTAPRVVTVASDSASLARATEAGSMFARSHESFAYSAAKAAVTMLTVKYANAFRDNPALSHIKINAVTPGYTATDLNNFAGTRTVEQGATIIVKMATIDADGPTGGFFDDEGTVPW